MAIKANVFNFSGDTWIAPWHIGCAHLLLLLRLFSIHKLNRNRGPFLFSTSVFIVPSNSLCPSSPLIAKKIEREEQLRVTSTCSGLNSWNRVLGYIMQNCKKEPTMQVHRIIELERRKVWLRVDLIQSSTQKPPHTLYPKCVNLESELQPGSTCPSPHPP